MVLVTNCPVSGNRWWDGLIDTTPQVCGQMGMFLVISPSLKFQKLFPNDKKNVIFQFSNVWQFCFSWQFEFWINLICGTDTVDVY
jgi:hypothetical protein